MPFLLDTVLLYDVATSHRDLLGTLYIYLMGGCAQSVRSYEIRQVLVPPGRVGLDLFCVIKQQYN